MWTEQLIVHVLQGELVFMGVSINKFDVVVASNSVLRPCNQLLCIYFNFLRHSLVFVGSVLYIIFVFFYIVHAHFILRGDTSLLVQIATPTT